MSIRRFALASLFLAACGGPSTAPVDSGTDLTTPDAGGADLGPPVDGAAPTPSLPLVLVADVDLPGNSTRFDYQDVDTAQSQLVVAHMNDDAVLVLDLATGAVRANLPGILTPRGVVVASDVGRIFVTSTPGHVVVIDEHTLMELSRPVTGAAPDGIGWDPTDHVVGVSDQSEGAISLIANSGDGTRTQVPLGVETGNVVYDAARARFWITVVPSSPPDLLVAVDPVAAAVTTTIPIPGCDGAHGLRIHPDGQSALIACENNDKLARVDLDGAHAVTLGSTGSGPDVLAIDPTLGWLYVAAESGELAVFDISQPGVVLVGPDHPGANSHTVAVDPATHRVFFPLPSGPHGTPVLRIMKPTGV